MLWLGLLGALVAAWVALGTGQGGPATYLDGPPGSWTVLTQAIWRLPDGSPQAVQLPHRVPDVTQIGATAVYEVPFTVDERHPPHHALGVCVLRWSFTGEAWLDGLRLTGPAPLDDAREYTRPQFIAVPPGLAPGSHQLTLRLTLLPEMDPGVSQLWFGDGDVVRRGCQLFAESKRNPAYAGAMLISVMGIAALTLWYRLRERSALLFTLMAAAWTFHFVHLNTVWLPMSVECWSLLYFITRVAFALPMFLFCLRFSSQVKPRLELAMALAYAASVGVLLLLPVWLRDEWLSAMAMLNLGGSLYFLWQLLRFALRGPSVAGHVLTGALAFVFTGHALDVARWVGLVPYSLTSVSYVAMPLMSASFLLLLVERLLQQTRDEATAAEELRRQVELQRTRIRVDYELMQQQREQAAVLSERRRILRDMHDGLGSQLVSASAVLRGARQVPNEQAARLIDGALLELRSVLDVLAADPADGSDDDPVATLLGTLRWRIEPALAAQGIGLDWHLDPLPAGFLPDDTSRLQLLRLLHEAIANVLKHAKATRVAFEARHEDGVITLRLADNGTGIHPERSAGEHRGVGLTSMERRAGAIGAELGMRNAPGGGCEVQLTWRRAPPSSVAVQDH